MIDAASVGAPFAAMSVYYDALELNTAVKPYVFKHLLAAARRDLGHLPRSRHLRLPPAGRRSARAWPRRSWC